MRNWAGLGTNLLLMDALPLFTASGTAFLLRGVPYHHHLQESQAVASSPRITGGCLMDCTYRKQLVRAALSQNLLALLSQPSRDCLGAPHLSQWLLIILVIVS